MGVLVLDGLCWIGWQTGGWMDGLVEGWSWAGEHGIRSCLPLWGSIVFGVPGGQVWGGEISARSVGVST